MSKRGSILIVWLGLAISITLNVIQGMHILRLESDETVKREFLEGSAVPPLPARDLSGHLGVVDYRTSEIPTVLYVFSPSCKWCQMNAESISSFAKQTVGKYRLIGISLSTDGVEEFIRENHVTFQVYLNAGGAAAKPYHLGATPETIVISSDGRVLKTWYGAYLAKNKVDIEQFFKIRLPKGA